MRKAVADITKRVFRDNTVKHLETFLACRLIPLDKQLGVRPIRIGEILICVIEKVVMKLLKKRCTKSYWIFKALRRTRRRQ